MHGLTGMVAPNIAMIDAVCIVFIVAILAFFAYAGRIKKDKDE